MRAHPIRPLAATALASAALLLSGCAAGGGEPAATATQTQSAAGAALAAELQPRIDDLLSRLGSSDVRLLALTLDDLIVGTAAGTAYSGDP